MSRYHHEMPFGAALLEGGGVRFRLYAPSVAAAAVVYDAAGGERRVDFGRTADGFFEAVVPEAGAGTRYAFDADGQRVPDPASRFNPDGPGGQSMVVDPRAFAWPEPPPLPPWEHYVVYEMHIGTFTPEGTYAAAIGKLDDLAALGITAIELMPLADAPGTRNWGYDGVLLYAPSHNYGSPDELKALIAAAHARGIAVMLDVVYNHFGPQGNYLHGYAKEFYTDRHHTPWGAAIDVEPDDRETVRAFFYENALYWLNEYRFDGLRFDAINAIFDGPQRRFMREVATVVAERSDREVYLVVENDENESALLDAGFRAQWNDDAHHAAHVLLTGQRDGYYSDYASDPVGRLARALTEGFIYQGEPSPYRGGHERGTESKHLRLTSFVNFLQNHDQIGNRPFGNRIASLTSAEKLRALLATILLAPSIPMLFMGEEWAASTPFLYFCDFEGDLAGKVTAGRREEFKQFAEFADPAARERIPDPAALETFEASKLRWDERTNEPHAGSLAFYRALLDIRRREIAPRIADLRGTDAAIERAGESGIAVRYRLGDGSMLALDANLGDAPVAAGTQRTGREIFSTQQLADATLPAWFVRWSLA